jgi:hypothetical protein
MNHILCLQLISPLVLVSHMQAQNVMHTVWPRFVFFMHLPTSSEPVQATDQFVEFLRNFYAVFPEYRTMDVGLLNLTFSLCLSVHMLMHRLDLHSRREFCRTVHSLLL